MNRPTPQADWPESWRLSYEYDLMEVWGDASRDSGYFHSYRVRRRVTLELVDSVASPPARILDVAAAQGNFTLALAERGYRTTWNDIRGELADYVSAKHERGQVTYAPGNVFELKPTGEFDVVLATEVIEHVAHPDRFLEHLGYFVRPKGHLVVTTPNGAYVRNKLPRFSDDPDPSRFESVQFRPNADGHIWLLHPDEVAPLARNAGLVLRELRLFTNPLTAGWMRTSRLLRQFSPRAVDTVEAASSKLPQPARLKLMTHMAIVLQRTD